MFAERLQLEKELQAHVDEMPTKVLEILLQYAVSLKAAYVAKEQEDRKGKP